MVKKRIIEMSFNLNINDISILLEMMKCDSKSKERHLILVDGIYYKLRGIPDGIRITSKADNVTKLQLKPVL
jgi:hypothetical protein